MENSQKLRLLYLAKILLRRTDEEHPLDRLSIEKELNQYGIEPSERKTFYKDIRVLRTFGLDIIDIQEGKSVKYYIGSRFFELAELKVLVDSIQSSRFITHKKTLALIDKLELLVSDYDAGQLERQVYVAGRIKNDNEAIYYNVDSIHTAINANRRIAFQYFDWSLPDDAGKGIHIEKCIRHDGKTYNVSPWMLLSDNQNYYLVGYNEELSEIRHYRVDKMLNITISDQKRTGEGEFKKINAALYSNRFFSMFDGYIEEITIQTKREMIHVFYDRFGEEAKISVNADGSINIVVKVAISEQFLGWILALGKDVRLLGPDRVISDMRKMLQKGVEIYMNQS